MSDRLFNILIVPGWCCHFHWGGLSSEKEPCSELRTAELNEFFLLGFWQGLAVKTSFYSTHQTHWPKYLLFNFLALGACKQSAMSKWRLILAALCCGKYYKRKHHPTLWAATLAPSVSLPPWLAPGLLCSHGWSLPHQPHAAIHPLWLWSQFPVTRQNQNSRGL